MSVASQPAPAAAPASEGKRTISVSQINLYLLCSLKYRFHYVEKLPAPSKASALALGSAVHSAVEWFVRERLGGREPKAESTLRVFRADWQAQTVEPISYKRGESEGSLRAMGEELVNVYLEFLKDRNVVASEIPFEVPLIDPVTGEELAVVLKGYMDLLEASPDDDGRETVVELKTAARRYDDEAVERNLQVTAYSYAYQVLNGRAPKLRLDTLIKTKVPQLVTHEPTRSDEDHKWFLALAKETARAVEAGVFLPHVGWQCSDCEHRPECSAWRGK